MGEHGKYKREFSVYVCVCTCERACVCMHVAQKEAKRDCTNQKAQIRNITYAQGRKGSSIYMAIKGITEELNS